MAKNYENENKTGNYSADKTSGKNAMNAGKNSSKNKIGAKNSKFKDVLVKFMFNLEYGNICKY